MSRRNSNELATGINTVLSTLSLSQIVDISNEKVAFEAQVENLIAAGASESALVEFSKGFDRCEASVQAEIYPTVKEENKVIIGGNTADPIIVEPDRLGTILEHDAAHANSEPARTYGYRHVSGSTTPVAGNADAIVSAVSSALTPASYRPSADGCVLAGGRSDPKLSKRRSSLQSRASDDVEDECGQELSLSSKVQTRDRRVSDDLSDCGRRSSDFPTKCCTGIAGTEMDHVDVGEAIMCHCHSSHRDLDHADFLQRKRPRSAGVRRARPRTWTASRPLTNMKLVWMASLRLDRTGGPPSWSARLATMSIQARGRLMRVATRALTRAPSPANAILLSRKIQRHTTSMPP